eukprot:3767233-Prymnesium_polylepis.2
MVAPRPAHSERDSATASFSFCRRGGCDAVLYAARASPAVTLRLVRCVPPIGPFTVPRQLKSTAAGLTAAWPWSMV